MGRGAPATTTLMSTSTIEPALKLCEFTTSARDERQLPASGAHSHKFRNLPAARAPLNLLSAPALATPAAVDVRAASAPAGASSLWAALGSISGESTPSWTSSAAGALLNRAEDNEGG